MAVVMPMWPEGLALCWAGRTQRCQQGLTNGWQRCLLQLSVCLGMCRAAGKALVPHALSSTAAAAAAGTCTGAAAVAVAELLHSNVSTYMFV
jgi:hypothetical protein